MEPRIQLRLRYLRTNFHLAQLHPRPLLNIGLDEGLLVAVRVDEHPLHEILLLRRQQHAVRAPCLITAEPPSHCLVAPRGVAAAPVHVVLDRSRRVVPCLSFRVKSLELPSGDLIGVQLLAQVLEDIEVLLILRIGRTHSRMFSTPKITALLFAAISTSRSSLPALHSRLLCRLIYDDLERRCRLTQPREGPLRPIAMFLVCRSGGQLLDCFRPLCQRRRC